MLSVFLEIMMLVTALSVDAFAAGFSYGVSKIKVPPLSVVIVTAVSSLTLAASLLAGDFLSTLLPGRAAGTISFVILFVLGLVKLFDRSGTAAAREANKNRDDLVSPGEALTLGAALSLDSVAAGVGAGVTDVYIPGAFWASFLVGVLALLAGCHLGHLVSSRCRADLCWISGVLLLLLAFMKLF